MNYSRRFLKRKRSFRSSRFKFLEAAVKMIPDTYTAIDEEAAKKF